MQSDRAGQHEDAGQGPADYGRRFSVWILGVFVLISACLLAAKWETFQENRHIRACRKYHNNLQFVDAIPHLKARLEKEPDSSYYLKDLAHGYLMTGKPDQALEVIRHLREVKPATDVNLELGSIWFEKGDLGKAGEHLEKARTSIDYRKRDTDLKYEKYRVAQYNYYMGRLYLELGRIRQSADSFYMASVWPYWDNLSRPYRKQLADTFLRASEKL
jgi:tetratricopeptide (TPR) repeat protein